jgi:stage V sporulation protein R
MSELEREAVKIAQLARDEGFDPFPIHLEIVDHKTMSQSASYDGFPRRWPHWKWGMKMQRNSKQHEYGLGKLYELIINTNPPVAYLMVGNNMTEQRTVLCHIQGHSHYFKHNRLFRATDLDGNAATDLTISTSSPHYNPNRSWVDRLSNNANIIEQHASNANVGARRVEEFIDYCLSIENLIDPHAPFVPKKPVEVKSDKPEAVELHRFKTSEYLDDFLNPPEYLEEQKAKIQAEKEQAKRFPEQPERDVLGFLLANSPLEKWEADILRIIREESYYFAPQWQTSISNEGIATFLHTKLMTEKVATTAEIIDYCDMNSGVMATSKTRLNPYTLGCHLFRNIEERWDKGQFGKQWEECDDAAEKANWDLRLGLGRQKVLEVVKTCSDLSLIDTYLTPEFAEEQKLFSFGWSNRNDRYEIQSREFDKVKKSILDSLTNGGQPVVVVEDGNYDNRGELLLKHIHPGGEDQDLKMDWARDCLRSLHALWKRPTLLLTEVEGKQMMMRYDGEHSIRGVR